MKIHFAAKTLSVMFAATIALLPLSGCNSEEPPAPTPPPAAKTEPKTEAKTETKPVTPPAATPPAKTETAKPKM